MRIVYKNRRDYDTGELERTWHDVKADRALDTTYTNTKSYPIEVSVTIDHPSGTAGRQGRLVIGGVIVAETYVQASTNNVRVITPITATVPAGETYSLNAISGTISIFRWTELY